MPEAPQLNYFGKYNETLHPYEGMAIRGLGGAEAYKLQVWCAGRRRAAPQQADQPSRLRRLISSLLDAITPRLVGTESKARADQRAARMLVEKIVDVLDQRGQHLPLTRETTLPLSDTMRNLERRVARHGHAWSDVLGASIKAQLSRIDEEACGIMLQRLGVAEEEGLFPDVFITTARSLIAQQRASKALEDEVEVILDSLERPGQHGVSGKAELDNHYQRMLNMQPALAGRDHRFDAMLEQYIRARLSTMAGDQLATLRQGVDDAQSVDNSLAQHPFIKTITTCIHVQNARSALDAARQKLYVESAQANLKGLVEAIAPALGALDTLRDHNLRNQLQEQPDVARRRSQLRSLLGRAASQCDLARSSDVAQGQIKEYLRKLDTRCGVAVEPKRYSGPVSDDVQASVETSVDETVADARARMHNSASLWVLPLPGGQSQPVGETFVDGLLNPQHNYFYRAGSGLPYERVNQDSLVNADNTPNFDGVALAIAVLRHEVCRDNVDLTSFVSLLACHTTHLAVQVPLLEQPGVFRLDDVPGLLMSDTNDAQRYDYSLTGNDDDSVDIRTTYRITPKWFYPEEGDKVRIELGSSQSVYGYSFTLNINAQNEAHLRGPVVLEHKLTVKVRG